MNCTTLLYTDLVETPRGTNQHGILKTNEKTSKSQEVTENLDQRSPNGLLSRVTFNLDADKAEFFDLDNEADREIQAIMNKTPETVDHQVLIHHVFLWLLSLASQY